MPAGSCRSNPSTRLSRSKHFLPVEQGELAQAGKRVPDRYLILRLAVLLAQAQLTRGSAKRALQPALHRCQRGPFVIEVIDQLRGEIGARAGWVSVSSARSRRAGWDLAGWPRSAGSAQKIGDFSLTQLGQRPAGEMPDPLNEHHAQHLGDGPEFANRERPRD
jgi:hypothetical protein